MYSIKTDLEVTGNSTVNKELLVKGNAVFKQNLTVEGTVTFADAVFTQITADQVIVNSTLDVTGKASLKGGMDVTGNSVIGSATAGSDTLVINSNASFNGTTGFASNVTQTAGKAIFQDTQVNALDVKGATTLEGNLTASTGTTATFDKLVADDATFTTTSSTDITSTGTANFKDVNISGVLGGQFSLSDVNATNLTVTGLTSLQGAVNLGANITGANTTASFKDIKIGANNASQSYKIGFTYTAPSLRPTVILQNEIQSELMSPANLTVLKTATFGDAALSTNGITANGLNKFDYLTISGNDVQSPTTPLLSVTKGKTLLTDLEVTGNATFANLNATTATVGDLTVTGVLDGQFTLGDITANTLTINGLTYLKGAVNLDSNITGANTVATVKEVKLGSTLADPAVKLGFNYTEAGKRPTVILQNEIQSELISPANLTVLKTATFGDAALATNSITSKGLNQFDYLNITGNAVQDPTTPRLRVNGKSILNDVEFTGVVTGLTVDLTGQDITPATVTTTGNVEVGGALSANGIASTGPVSAPSISTTGNATIGEVISAKSIALSDATATNTVAGNVTVNGQTVTVKDLVVTGTTTGVTAEANVDGLDIAPNKVDVTTTLGVTGKSTLGELAAGASTLASATVTGASTLAATTATTLNVTGTSTLAGVTATTLAVPTVTGNTSFTGDVSVTGTLTPGSIDLSTTAVNAASVKTTGNVEVGGDLIVTGAIDLSAADVSVKSITATSAQSTIPTLSSTTATITTVNAGTVAATGNISGVDIAASGAITGASATVTGITKSGSIESATVQAAPAGAGTVTIASDAVAAKNLTVTGTLKPEGGLDLSTVDISSKSITTTEGATIGGNLSVAGTVDLSAADVTALSFVSTDAEKTNTFPKLSSTDSTLGAAKATTVNVTGASTLAGVTATSLGVTGASTLAGLTAGATTLASAAITGVATIDGGITTTGTTISLAKNTAITGDLSVSGTLTAGIIDLSTTDVTVKSLESLGNAHIVGNLTVDGTFDLSATDLAAASLASSGNTTVGADLILTTGTITGAPSISGNTSVGGTLDVTGATTLAGLTAGASTLASASVTANATVGGTLGVTGVTTLAHTVANSLSVSGTGTLGSLAVPVGDSSLGGNLTVGGDSTVQKLTVKGQFIPEGGFDLSSTDVTAQSFTTAGTLDVTGLSTLTGGVSTSTLSTSGLATLNSVSVTTNASVTGTTSLTGALTANAATFGGDVTMNQALTVKGILTPELGLDLTNTDVSAKSLATSGTLTIGGNSTLTGTLSSGALTAATVTTPGLAKVNSLTVDTTALVTGALTVNGTSISAPNATTVGMGAAALTTKTLKVSDGDVKIGTVIGSRTENVQIFGSEYVSGNLIVDGEINADINLTGRTIEPFAVEASDHLSSAGAITAGGTLTAPTAVVGAVGSTNNNLTINGNAVATGDFTVSGRIIGTLDQSTSDVTAKSITATTFVKATTALQSEGTLSVTGNSTLTGTLTSGAITAPSATLNGTGTALNVTNNATIGGTLGVTGVTTLGVTSITNGTVSGTLGVTGAATFGNNVTVTGIFTSNGNVVLGDAAADTLTVNATSTFKELATFEKGVSIAGTFTTDVADFTTNTVVTKKYSVVPTQLTASTIGATWTPDGTTNVYFLNADANIAVAPITGLIGGGKSSSVYIYVKQDATGNRTVTFDGTYSKVGGDINLAPNSVSIIQVIYDGFSTVVDMFIAQRTA